MRVSTHGAAPSFETPPVVDRIRGTTSRPCDDDDSRLTYEGLNDENHGVARQVLGVGFF